MSKGRLVAQSPRIVAGGDEERGGSVGPDAESGEEFGCGLFDQEFKDGVELGDLLFGSDGPGGPACEG